MARLSAAAYCLVATPFMLATVARVMRTERADRKSTRLNSSHTVIYTLSLHDALPICLAVGGHGQTVRGRVLPGRDAVHAGDGGQGHEDGEGEGGGLDRGLGHGGLLKVG